GWWTEAVMVRARARHGRAGGPHPNPPPQAGEGAVLRAWEPRPSWPGAGRVVCVFDLASLLRFRRAVLHAPDTVPFRAWRWSVLVALRLRARACLPHPLAGEGRGGGKHPERRGLLPSSPRPAPPCPSCPSCCAKSSTP